MSERIGVVLLNLGGPDSLDAVEPFLYNLFSDPDIIDFPGSFLFRKRLAKMISTRRAPMVQEQYKKIGGKSPLKDHTLKQAALLEERLNEKIPAKVYAAMRYWKPSTDEALGRDRKGRRQNGHPAAALPSVLKGDDQSSAKEWEKQVECSDGKRIETTLIESYYDFEPTYIDASSSG